MKILATVFSLLALATASAVAQNGYVVTQTSIHQDYAEDAETYGQRDIDELLDELQMEVTEALEEAGLLSSSGRSIELVLNDAKPNRPTMEQMSDNPSLSYDSFSRGGADITAIIREASGDEIGRFQYDWYTHDITEASYRSTWADANRTIHRFAERLSDHLSDMPAS